MKPEDLITTWRTGLRWFDERGEHEYGWAIPLITPGGTEVEVLPHFRLKHGMTDEDGRAIQRFHEAAPAMSSALLAALKHGGDAKWMEDEAITSLHDRIRAALTLAGVPLP
jgi:hypothetical protein